MFGDSVPTSWSATRNEPVRVAFKWRLMGVMTGTLPPGRCLCVYGCYLHAAPVWPVAVDLPERDRDNHRVINIRYKGSKAGKNCKHGIFLRSNAFERMQEKREIIGGRREGGDLRVCPASAICLPAVARFLSSPRGTGAILVLNRATPMGNLCGSDTIPLRVSIAVFRRRSVGRE